MEQTATDLPRLPEHWPQKWRSRFERLRDQLVTRGLDEDVATTRAESQTRREHFRSELRRTGGKKTGGRRRRSDKSQLGLDFGGEK